MFVFSSISAFDFCTKDNYLSESGVYPLIAVLSVAVSFGTYMMVHKLSTNPDIRINKKERGVIIRE
jgi:hypothetical protein